jgi:hypothetical protein
VQAPRAYPPASTILVEPEASPWRAHVTRMGEVSFALGGETSRDGGHRLAPELELVVVEERGEHVRIVVEHDGARSLLWLAADDLGWSLARTVQLAGAAGGDDGVWLSAGAPVTIEGRAKDGRRAIAYADDEVQLRGAVDDRVLARVFAGARPPQPTWNALADELLVAPGGAVLFPHDLPVEVVGRRGDWREVEYRSRYVRMRGWSQAVVEPVELTTSGTGSGSGIGMSDTARVAMAPGACLFDRERGDVVGVQLEQAERYVAGRRGDWWRLYVGTPWGLLEAWAHATGVDDAGAPRWQRCDGAVASGSSAPAPAPGR